MFLFSGANASAPSQLDTAFARSFPIKVGPKFS